VPHAVARGVLDPSDLPESVSDQVLLRSEQLKEIWAVSEGQDPD
jgi:hypothetical protein